MQRGFDSVIHPIINRVVFLADLLEELVACTHVCCYNAGTTAATCQPIEAKGTST